MYISDYLVPRLTGIRDRKNSKNTDENLFKQASTYRNTLDARYRKQEQSLITRSLANLRKAIAPLEVDHARFLQAAEAKKREVLQYAGVSDEARMLLAQNTENVVYTITINGVKTTLDIDKIMKHKETVCIEANHVIDTQNDHFKSLHTTFAYRLSEYLRAVNDGSCDKEIKVELQSKPVVLKHWNSSIPYSRAVNEDMGKEVPKHGDQYIVQFDASGVRKDMAR